MLQKKEPRFDCIRKRIDRAIDNRVFPCCVAGVTDTSKQRRVYAGGTFTYEDSTHAAEEDSVFDIASITKSIPTACLALQMLDRGDLTLETRFCEYIPELRGAYRKEVTLFHLLTHTIQFGFRLSGLKEESPEAILNAVCTTDYPAPPGTLYSYANATSILLGMLVERAGGDSIANLAEREFFGPLGMTRTGFFPKKQSSLAIVPAEYDPWRNRIICGEVHDESAYALRPRLIAGSAGLFSTVSDLLGFAEMLLDKGISGGRSFFSPAMIEAMHTNQIPWTGEKSGLGWELCRREYMGTGISGSAFGKTGFTGCVIIVDPVCGQAFVMLSNYTFPRRKKDRDAINSVRRDIANMVFFNTMS
ncbi:MAG: serine hydrolase [Chitinivibrionales bacterium]|nr:serine hydrolase [Chitinivibrionales bacterium]